MQEREPFDLDKIFKIGRDHFAAIDKAYPKQTELKKVLLELGVDEQEIIDYRMARFDLRRSENPSNIIQIDVAEQKRIIAELEEKYPFLKETYDKIMLESN